MIRKALAAVVTASLLLVSIFSFSSNEADARVWTCPYAWAVAGVCADAYPYPGPFTNHPPAPTGPYGWGALNITAGAAAPAGGAGGGEAPLAHTGNESAVLGYVGAGLVAFGAVAMGSRRKFFQGALD